MRRKARLKAERRHEEELIKSYGHPRHIVNSERWWYIRFVKGDGHWLNGGCSRARCGICQPREPSGREKREAERMRDSLREEL